MLPALTTGWRGLQRGLPQSYVELELELASPGGGSGGAGGVCAASAALAAHPARPAFADRLKAGMAAGMVGLGAVAAVLWNRRRAAGE